MDAVTSMKETKTDSATKTDSGEQGYCTFIAPVQGVAMRFPHMHELRIVDVTLITGKHLRRSRIRLGVPVRISDLEKEGRAWKDFFCDDRVYAVCRIPDRGRATRTYFEKKLEEELCILSFSQLAFSRRQHSARPCLGDAKTGIKKCIGGLSQSMSATLYQWRDSPSINELSLNGRWYGAQRDFFLRLLRILRSEISIDPTLVKKLRVSAALGGRSFFTKDLADAFLLQTIALENLLPPEYKEGKSEGLSDLAFAFLWWCDGRQFDDLRKLIKALYRKRSALVHCWETIKVRPIDVLAMDTILLNVMRNIVINCGKLHSCATIQRWAEVVRACFVLGKRPTCGRIRLSAIFPMYTEHDIDDLDII